MRHIANGETFSGSTDPQSAGNGSLMRLAPVPMLYLRDLQQVVQFSRESWRSTHGAEEAIDCCEAFGTLLAQALLGQPN